MGKKNKLSIQLVSAALLVLIPLSSSYADGPGDGGAQAQPTPPASNSQSAAVFGMALGQDSLLVKATKSILGPRMTILNPAAVGVGAEAGSVPYTPNHIENLDLISGDCQDCKNNYLFRDNSTWGVDQMNTFSSDLPRFYCEFPEQFAISPFITAANENPGGYRTANDLDFCGCVGGTKKQEMSFYSDIVPEEAARLCRQAGEHLIKKKFDEHLSAIKDMGVLKTIAQAALGITDGENICNGDASERIFKMTLGQDNEEGKRLCSSQSVAYIVNMMEKSGSGLVDGNRVAEYRSMKEAADALRTSADGVRSPAQIAAQASFDGYVASSPIFNLMKSEYDTVLSDRVKEVFPDAQGSSFTPESIAALASASGSSKAELAKKIVDMIFNNSNLNSAYGKYQSELLNIEVSGDVNLEAMLAGNAPMTEEIGEKLLRKFVQVSSNKCDRANENVVAQCKIVSSGLSFKPDTIASHRCALESNENFRELIDEPLKAFKSIIQNNAGYRHTASQLMCYQVLRHGTVMDDFTPGEARRCDPNSSQSRLSGLSTELSIPGGVESVFLGSQHERVLKEMSDCSPFTVGALGDEAKPFSDSNNFTEYMGQVVEDAESGTVADTQRTIIVAQQNGQDVSSAVRNAISGGRGSSYASGSTIGANNPNARISNRDAFSEISENAARRAAANSGSYTVPSDDFYSTMGTNTIQSVPDFSNFNVSDSSSSSSSASSSSGASSEDPLAAERRRIDEYLELLQNREEEYKKMVADLQRLGVKEVVNDQGETVSVEDAFAATNAKIEQQRSLAMREKEDIERRLRTAESSLDSGQNRRSVASNNGAGDESRPTVNSTPSGSSSGVGSGGASRSIASIGSGGSTGSSGSSVGSSGSNNSGADQYGPAPFSGIVLTSEELSIAKPQLDLGGRSLNESPDIIRAAIEAVKGEVRLPVQYVNGKPVLDYILQEKDGKTVMVYLEGEQVIVADVNLAVDTVQDEVVVEVTPEPTQEAQSEPEVRAPAQSGRKAWADVEAILDGAQ